MAVKGMILTTYMYLYMTNSADPDQRGQAGVLSGMSMYAPSLSMNKSHLEDADDFTTVDLGTGDTAPEQKPDTKRTSGIKHDMESLEGNECQPCKRSDEQASAMGFCVECDEFVCENCWNVHFKIRTLNKHSIIDVTKDGYRVEYTNTHAPNPSTIPKKLCLAHKGELLEYYCTKCVVLACSRCVRDSHRQCNTAHIPDLSKFVSKSDSFDESDKWELIKGLNATETGLTDVQRYLRYSITGIDRTHSDVAKECKMFLKDADMFFSAIIKYIKETTKEQVDEEIKHCRLTKIRAGNAMNEYTRLHSELMEMKNSPTKRNKQNLFRIVNEMNKIKTILMDKSSMDKHKQHNQTLAELDKYEHFVKEIRDFADSTDIIPMPAESVASFSTKTDTDTEPNVITGLLKTGEGLIVADRANGKLKLFDSTKGELVAELQYRYDMASSYKASYTG